MGIRLPDDAAERAARLIPAGLPGLRPVDPSLLHLTLAFIGHVDDGLVAPASEAVRAAAMRCTPLDVALTDLGRFPASGPPTVIWLGAAAGGGELVRLGEVLRGELRARAVPFDDKPFRPHLTLARVRAGIAAGEARAIGDALSGRRPEPLRFRAEAVQLIESVLSPRGPRYTTLRSMPLGAPEQSGSGRAQRERS